MNVDQCRRKGRDRTGRDGTGQGKARYTHTDVQHAQGMRVWDRERPGGMRWGNGQVEEEEPGRARDHEMIGGMQKRKERNNGRLKGALGRSAMYRCTGNMAPLSLHPRGGHYPRYICDHAEDGKDVLRVQVALIWIKKTAVRPAKV